jgi:nucleoside-diphosphate-sugar epimerase
MRIFVTGASGVIGRRVVPLLIDGGHTVTAAARSEAKRATLAKAGATPVGLDLFDRAAVERAVVGHQTIINLATHMPPSMTRMMLPWSWKENDHIRREGSAILADAAIKLGINRFIQESFAPAYPDRGAAWVTEETPLSPTRYNRSLLDAEASVQRVTRAGQMGIVLRFAAFYGPDAFTLHEMANMVRKGWSPLPGAPDAYISSVSHDDAATAVVAALDLPAGIYNVTDDEPVTRREFLDVFALAIGARTPRSLPRLAVKLMGSIGELGARSIRISNRKLRATGWAPGIRSVREGLPAALRGERVEA